MPTTTHLATATEQQDVVITRHDRTVTVEWIPATAILEERWEVTLYGPDQYPVGLHGEPPAPAATYCPSNRDTHAQAISHALHLLDLAPSD